MGEIDKKTFRDPSVYTNDRGLTKSDQEVPVKVTETDASWMKASIIENDRSGLIIDAATHQSFVPYQTQFETKQINTWGLVKQSDRHTPWAEGSADRWADTVNFPPDFRGIFDIAAWYAGKLETAKELYQWKTDIFGNQYGLYKDFGTPSSPKTIYSKKYAPGDFWVCTSSGQVIVATKALSAVFDNHLVSSGVSVFNQLTSNAIRDIDVFYDVLMVVTSTNILLDKILFNYDTGEISSLPEYSHTINLSGGKFADVWFFEDTKKVVFCSVSLLSGFPLPFLYELDLESDRFEMKFPLDTSDFSILQGLSAHSISAIDYPVFTYNESTKTYVIMLNTTTSVGNTVLISMNSKEGVYSIDQVWNYSPDNPR